MIFLIDSSSSITREMSLISYHPHPTQTFPLYSFYGCKQYHHAPICSIQKKENTTAWKSFLITPFFLSAASKASWSPVFPTSILYLRYIHFSSSPVLLPQTKQLHCLTWGTAIAWPSSFSRSLPTSNPFPNQQPKMFLCHFSS